MRGPFGGTWSAAGEAEAQAPLAVTDLLGAAPGDAPLAPRAGAAEVAALSVVLGGAGGSLEHRAEPGAWEGRRPWAEAPAPARLSALAAAGRLLAEVVHPLGRAHGDLRPGTIWLGDPEAVTLIATATPVDALALLRARLSAGAEPTDVCYVAPEVLAGAPASPAADVFALAALAYEALAGRPPLGAIQLPRHTAGLPDWVCEALGRALQPDPAARPDAAALAACLRQASQRPADAAVGGERPLTAAPVDAASAVEEVDLLAGEALLAAEGAEGAEEARTSASQSSCILALVLILAGSFVFVGSLGVLVAAWEVMGMGGQLLLFLLFTGALAGVGRLLEGRGYQRSGFALVVLATQMLWVDLGYLLVLLDLEEEEGAWTLGAAALSGVLFLLAAARRSATLGILSTLGWAVSVLCCAAWLRSGTDLGPLIYFACAGLVSAGLAFAGERLSGPRLGIPYVAGSLLWGLVSTVCALVLLADSEHKGFAVQASAAAWPYLVAAATLALAWLSRDVYRTLGWVSACAALVLTPTIEALIWYDTLGYLFFAVALGGILLERAFRWPPLAEDDVRQVSAVACALPSVTIAPLFLAWSHCFDRDGLALLEEAVRSGGRVHETRFVYLSVVCGVSAALVGLGYLFSAHAQRRLAYRMLEAAGLGLFFLCLTVLSLPDADWEVFYIGLLLAGGLLVVGLGVWARRAMLVWFATLALLLNVVIQYFAKLVDHVHWGFLTVGFGLLLIGGAVLYERKVKHLLPALRAWA